MNTRSCAGADGASGEDTDPIADTDLAALAKYVPRIVGGDPAAWTELAARLELHLLPLLRRSRTLGALRHSIDDCRAVMLRVLEQLSKDGYRGLRLFQRWADANPQRDFGCWIRIVTANIARDHASALFGGAASLSPADDDHPLALRPPMTNVQLAREFLEYAGQLLDHTQLHALRRWMDGVRLAEIAGELGLAAPRDAGALVRAALETLRRHLGGRAHG